jgi:hypothetical protein
MAVGDTITGIRVRKIRADRVELAGMDTVWTLRLPDPAEP